MRLKHREHAIAANRLGGSERGADFRGMMRIIIDQKKSIASVFNLETPARVPKVSK